MKEEKQNQKKHYIKILFPDGNNYIFNQYDDYDVKLAKVNEILDIWYDYIIDNWDKTLIINGSPVKPVPKMLSMLTYYLVYNTDKKLTELGILNLKTEKEIRNKEIPESCCDSAIGDLFYASSYNVEDNIKSSPTVGGKPEEFDKRNKRFQHLEGINKEFIMGVKIGTLNRFESLDDVVKLKDFGDSYCFYVNKYLVQNKKKDEVVKNLLWHYDTLRLNYKLPDKTNDDKNFILKYAKKSYMTLLTQFEKIELVKAHVLGGKPYEWKWAIVDEDGYFEFRNIKYKTLSNYQFDKILCYYQDGKERFYDVNIHLEVVRELNNNER